MRVKYKNSLEFKILERLNRMRSNVILRRDFDEIGSHSQVTRVFKKLVTHKRLVKIGFGIYAKAHITKYSDVPLVKGGIDSAFTGALKKLGVIFEPGSAEQAYAAGQTTQIPARKIIKLKSRCRRKISYGKARLIFEDNVNAK